MKNKNVIRKVCATFLIGFDTVGEIMDGMCQLADRIRLLSVVSHYNDGLTSAL